jgi:hypothetical integral membrane protein (TIGR02206 family)
MDQYFAKDYHGEPFVLFGPAHFAALGILALVNLLLILTRHHHHPKLRLVIRYGVAGLLILNEIGLHTWKISTNQWSIQWNLPLHLCSILVWLSAYMLITKNRQVFEMVYFLGIAGALQALLTPDAGIYGFPHYYPIQYFISHGSIITAAVYMAAVERYRPYWSSIKRVFVWVNFYLIIVTIINLLIGSNYLYTLRKPHVITLIDFLGPWPWYLLSAELIALIHFLILYSPYAIADKRKRTT